MTIKKRLALSNVLMILVPVVITMIIALACLGMILSMITHGQGLSFDDNEDFYQAGSGLAARVKANLKQYERLTGKDGHQSRIDVGDISIDTSSHRVTVKGNPAEE